jgi:hypothetical protein
MKPKKLKNVRSFVIDRNVWARGEKDNVLLDSTTGKMCCLGIYLKACGASDKRLKNVGSPSDAGDADTLPKWMVGEVFGFSADDAPTVRKLIRVNDAKAPKDREGKIAKLFAEAGVKVRFKG